jgi:L-ribulokinase
MKDAFVIGVDFGTDSVRAVVVDARSGQEMAQSVFVYPRWSQGMYCDPAGNRFRQHPLDYLEGIESTITDALSRISGVIREKIVGISVDTTGSTPVAVDRNGVPLSLTKEFEEDPDAMFILWKDHTAVHEAERINTCSKSWGGIDYTKYVGGIYSSEWFWAKILHLLRTNKSLAKSAFSWVEHCDWITAELTGHTDPLEMKRSRCAAGHKAMWHEEFGGLPSDAFLGTLDPLLKGISSRLYTLTHTSDRKAGSLSPVWAKMLGLSEKVVIGVGAFDAHMGAVGAGIEPYHLCKVMGTSTCDMLVAPVEEMKGRLVKGICGQVNGSIIPGMTGMEAGQSAFGDIFAWFKNLLMWPQERFLDEYDGAEKKTIRRIADDVKHDTLSMLEKAASRLPADASSSVAVDWFNGRRTPDADQTLTGAIMGLGLGSDAPYMYRTLVESAAFGARKIVDRFVSEGVPIRGIIALGGVAKKSPFVMQTMSDVLGMNIRVSKSEQACALGAAMFASVAAGIHPSIAEAQSAMGSGFEREYVPMAENAAPYNLKYAKYSSLADYIERVSRGES